MMAAETNEPDADRPALRNGEAPNRDRSPDPYGFRSQLYMVAALLLAVVLLPGCSGDAGPERGEVTGRVTLDGQPLKGATVRFHPDEGRPSVDETDSDGRYTLRYTMQKSGVLVGTHKVRITTAREREDGSLTTEHVPAQYNTQSELVREVESGNNVFDFELKR